MDSVTPPAILTCIMIKYSRPVRRVNVEFKTSVSGITSITIHVLNDDRDDGDTDLRNVGSQLYNDMLMAWKI
jgi:hypothetical protein